MIGRSLPETSRDRAGGVGWCGDGWGNEVMSVGWRERNGRRYLEADYRRASTTAQMSDLLEELSRRVREADDGDVVRLLVRADAGQRPDSSFLAVAKRSTRSSEWDNLRVAVVGLGAFGRMVLGGVKLVRPQLASGAFDSDEKAFEFLFRV